MLPYLQTLQTVISGPKYVVLTAYFSRYFPEKGRFLTDVILEFPKCVTVGNLTLILRRYRTGTVWFYTSTSNKRAARPKLYTKSLIRDLKRMYSRLTLVRISINL